MSYLDGGQGPRVPTASAFPATPPQNAQEPQGAPPATSEGEAHVQTPPPNFAAHLKSLATMCDKEKQRFYLLSTHKEAWAAVAGELSVHAGYMAFMLRELAGKIECAPFPLRPISKPKGV